MSAWLDLVPDTPVCGPIQLAEWLRTLPISRVPEETKKAIARRVIEQDLDSNDFQEIVTNQRWDLIAVDDERQAACLSRLFKQRQREATLAAAARQNALANQSIKGMRGEALVA